jgi:hypothetical protein
MPEWLMPFLYGGCVGSTAAVGLAVTTWQWGFRAGQDDVLTGDEASENRRFVPVHRSFAEDQHAAVPVVARGTVCGHAGCTVRH